MSGKQLPRRPREHSRDEESHVLRIVPSGSERERERLVEANSPTSTETSARWRDSATLSRGRRAQFGGESERVRSLYGSHFLGTRASVTPSIFLIAVCSLVADPTLASVYLTGRGQLDGSAFWPLTRNEFAFRGADGQTDRQIRFSPHSPSMDY